MTHNLATTIKFSDTATPPKCMVRIQARALTGRKQQIELAIRHIKMAMTRMAILGIPRGRITETETTRLTVLTRKEIQ